MIKIVHKNKQPEINEEELYKMKLYSLKDMGGKKRFVGVQLIPIKAGKTEQSVFSDTKYTGIGGEYPTAIIDKSKLKLTYVHI